MPSEVAVSIDLAPSYCQIMCQKPTHIITKPHPVSELLCIFDPIPETVMKDAVRVRRWQVRLRLGWGRVRQQHVDKPPEA